MERRLYERLLVSALGVLLRQRSSRYQSVLMNHSLIDKNFTNTVLLKIIATGEREFSYNI